MYYNKENIDKLKRDNEEHIKWLNIANNLIISAKIIINELEKENKDLKTDNNTKQKEIIDYKKKIKELNKNEIALNKLLIKEHSDWYTEADLAWRINPITLESEKYKIPKNFNPNHIKDLDVDFDTKICTFKNPNDYDNDCNDYTIPCSLYSHLGGKIFLNNKELAQNLDTLQFKTIEDIEKYILTKGESLGSKYHDKILQFILEHENKRFTTKEFNDFCKFNNRESSRQFLNKLITLNIIRRVTQGLYEFVNQ